MRKTIYLILAILGTVLPLWQFIGVIGEHGLNIPKAIELATANGMAAGGWIDLFISSFAFWLFLTEGKRLRMKNLWAYVVLNLCVGLSLSLPLFLYFREDAKEGSTE